MIVYAGAIVQSGAIERVLGPIDKQKKTFFVSVVVCIGSASLFIVINRKNK